MLEPIEEFCSQIKVSFANRVLRSIVVGNASTNEGQSSTDSLPPKFKVRPIETKRGDLLQWESIFPTQRSHKNLTIEESIARIAELFPEQYRDLYLFTDTGEWNLRQVATGPVLNHSMTNKTSATKPSHNRKKNYLIPEGTPCDFLHALGIMTADGKVKPSKQKKFRQINRYLEIVNDVVPDLPEHGPLRIVDFGCGLSYLTFALHHLLKKIHKRDAQLIGIDQRSDVISRCEKLVDDLNFTGLEFSQGKIEETASDKQFDLAVSLHACDTATDAALAYSVKANAKVILAVPCCQHEIFSQVAHNDLNFILKHGILKERFAAMTTDALRVVALEATGYKAQIMEFIDLEHTPKNLLIRAVKRTSSSTGKKLEEYHSLKEQFELKSLATDQILEASSDES